MHDLVMLKFNAVTVNDMNAIWQRVSSDQVTSTLDIKIASRIIHGTDNRTDSTDF